MVSARHELRCLLDLAVPSALSTYCFFAVSITEISVVGHLGVDELAAVAYAQMCLDLSILVSMQGFNAGMNTLCSQAFGAKNFDLLGKYALLTSLLLTVACVPLALLWWNLGSLLLAAGVSERVAALAGVYCRWSLLWLWPRSMFQVFSCFYQAQQIVQPTAVFNVLAVALNSFLVVGLTHGRFGLPEHGFIGCPLGTAVALFVRLVAYVVYMNWYRDFQYLCAWCCDDSFLDVKILQNLLAVGLPLAAGTLFENAQLITMTLFAATMVSASVTRMGMYLGAGNPMEALLVAKVCGVCIALLTVINSVVVMSARRQLGRLFSDNPQVIDTFSQICALAALAYFVMAFFYYAYAVLKAQTRPIPIMVGFACGAWLVGVPAAYVLGVHQSHPNLPGVWHGMICGYAVTSAIAFAVAFGRPNWHLEAEKAVARSHVKEKQLLFSQESEMLLGLIDDDSSKI